MESSYLETKSDNDKFFELVKVSRKKQAASYGAMNLTNPTLIVALSVIFGAIFGMLSGKLSCILGK